MLRSIAYACAIHGLDTLIMSVFPGVWRREQRRRVTFRNRTVVPHREGWQLQHSQRKLRISDAPRVYQGTTFPLEANSG